MYGSILAWAIGLQKLMVGDNKGSGRRGRRAVQGLTPAQGRALATIRQFAVRHGFPPTVKELGDELGIAPASAHELTTGLERKGYLRRSPGKARSLEILPQPRPDTTQLVAVPIVGRVPAGTPLLAAENVVGELLVDGRTARGRCFALEVQGDSLIDADIQDGDYVIVRQQQLAESGEIVVAMFEGEATVKRLCIAGEAIELRPENRRLSPIPIGPDDDLRILGKVVAVHRREPGGTRNH
jgi:repressor LexA